MRGCFLTQPGCRTRRKTARCFQRERPGSPGRCGCEPGNLPESGLSECPRWVESGHCLGLTPELDPDTGIGCEPFQRCPRINSPATIRRALGPGQRVLASLPNVQKVLEVQE